MPSQERRHIKLIVAANIKAAREAQGLVQREVAARLEMDSVAVSRWERGKVMPTLTNLSRLADVLDRDVAWFYVDHDQVAA